MDIAHMSFEEWKDFTFDHPVTEPAWHFSDEWNYECSNPARLIEYLIRLFNAPQQVLSKYSISQIDQGMWFIPGPNGYLWSWLDESIALSLRMTSISSVESLFDLLFAKQDIGTSGYMWWDSVFTYCSLGDVSIFERKAELTATIVAIGKQTRSSSKVTRDAAMHGVEHLIQANRSRSDPVLRRLIEEHIDPLALGPSVA